MIVFLEALASPGSPAGTLCGRLGRRSGNDWRCDLGDGRLFDHPFCFVTFAALVTFRSVVSALATIVPAFEAVATLLATAWTVVVEALAVALIAPMPIAVPKTSLVSIAPELAVATIAAVVAVLSVVEPASVVSAPPEAAPVVLWPLHGTLAVTATLLVVIRCHPRFAAASQARLRPRPGVLGELLGIAVLAELFAFGALEATLPVPETAALLAIPRLLELLAVGHDDAVVVLRMLEVILGQNRIAGGLGVSRQGHVFLSDVRRCPTDLHVGSVRLEVARERILMFAVTAASTPVLLSLPHGPKGSSIAKIARMRIGTKPRPGMCAGLTPNVPTRLPPARPSPDV